MSSGIEADHPRAGTAGEHLFDAIVIGTGFGGAVAACRLAQAGKDVCILERGRRYGPGDFPRLAKRPDHLPHTARWLWALDHGLWDVKDLQGTLAVQAAGFGGGSLVYANVHLRAPSHVFSPTTTHGEDASGWPACYTRAELDPYYDVVAAVLRVQPLPDNRATAEVPKVQVMREAVSELNREQWLCRPPLAIDFAKCTMCGECVVGCQIQAKNTLDLNYLKAAEDMGAEVRTLAEVEEIQEDADRCYTVRYFDNVTRRKDVTVRARSVFLCAGSVNSTRILLASKTLPIPKESRQHIGRRFFANGDAIAMVYDTQRAAAPRRGPTITSALLYHGRPSGREVARGEWFLVQDGGYPKWLEHVLGLFRGAFWLERNRIEAETKIRTPSAVDSTAQEATRERARETADALLGVLKMRRALQRQKDAVARGDELQALEKILPPQIRDQLRELHRFVTALEKKETGTVSRETLEEVIRLVLEAKPKWERCILKPLFRLGKMEVKRQLLRGTLHILHQHFLKAPPNTQDPFNAAILWPLAIEAADKLFLGTRPDDHAFLMLAMGIDVAPGRLYLDDGQLLAEWDLAANEPFSTMEERLMHDLAGKLGGEMRLNPDWTATQRPVAVHNLGGCAMADRAEDGVADPNGKVWGTRAIYVLDGAAMPGSLGVNPSATIAAIAERNVRKALADPSSVIYHPEPVPTDPPLPGGKSLATIRAELGQTYPVLDPISPMHVPVPEPDSKAIGLQFKEVMEGFYAADGKENLPIRAEFVAAMDDLNAFLVHPLHPLNISGRVWLTSLPNREKVAYHANGTLYLFKRAWRVDPLQQSHLKQALEAVERVNTLKEVCKADCQKHARRDTERQANLQAKRDAETALESLLERLGQQAYRYEMEYDVALTLDDSKGEPYRLHGVKKIYGAKGLDAWTETTTLAITLWPANGERPATGTMRVHVADFFGTQLPSFRVTGTKDEDDVRIAWAFGRFLRFFLGRLRNVYLPRRRMLDPFGDKEG